MKKKYLLKVIDIISNEIKNNCPEKIDYEHNFYWEISEESIFDIQNKPNDFFIGQISDDWKELLNL